MLYISLSKEKVIAVFSVAGFVLAFVATVYELYEFIDLLVGRLNIFPSIPT